MDIKLTVEEHAILSIVCNHIPIAVGGRNNPVLHVHSPATLIDITRALCIQRLLGSSHHALLINQLFDKLEEIFSLPFSDLDPNPYQEPTT